MFRFIKLALAIFFVNAHFSHANDSYVTEVIKAQPHSVVTEKLGVFSYLDEMTLAFKSSGYVQKIAVEQGDRVSAGQMLASIDATELVHQAQALTFRLGYTEKEQKRLTKLYEKGLIPKSSIDQIDSQRNELNEQLKQTTYLLINSKLHADVAGVVTRRVVSQGELVGVGQAIMTIAPDKNNLMATFWLNKEEIETLQKYQKVKLYDNRREILGSVLRLAVIANVNGLYQTDIVINDADSFRSGANIKLRLELGSHSVFAISHQTPIEVSSNQATVLIKSAGQFIEKKLEIVGMDEQLIFVEAETLSEEFVVNGWISR